MPSLLSFEAKPLPSPGSPRGPLDSGSHTGKAIYLLISPKHLKPDRAWEDRPGVTSLLGHLQAV